MIKKQQRRKSKQIKEKAERKEKEEKERVQKIEQEKADRIKKEEKAKIDAIKTNITITDIVGKDLIVADIGGSSDPYVKFWLIIDKKAQNDKETVKKQTTYVIENTLFPIWKNQSFNFQVPDHLVAKNTELFCEIWDKDLLSDDYMGQVTIPFTSFSESKVQEFTVLGKGDKADKPRGKLQITVQYN